MNTIGFEWMLFGIAILNFCYAPFMYFLKNPPTKEEKKVITHFSFYMNLIRSCNSLNLYYEITVINSGREASIGALRDLRKRRRRPVNVLKYFLSI